MESNTQEIIHSINPLRIIIDVLGLSELHFASCKLDGIIRALL